MLACEWLLYKEVTLTIIVPSNFIDVFSYSHIWAFSL